MSVIRELQFYVTSSGKCYGEEFLLKLSKKASKDYGIIRARLARALTGNFGNLESLEIRPLSLKYPLDQLTGCIIR